MAARDRLRELTATGRAEVERGSELFRQHCRERGIAEPDRLYRSAWLRAAQTAEIICNALDITEAQESAALLPGSHVQQVDEWLAGIAGAPAHVLLVSHQPLVSRLADHYLGDYGRVPPLSPGGQVTLSLDVAAPDGGQLLFWSLPPAYQAGV